MDDNGAVGGRLRQVRKRRGLTQRDLARESRVSLSLIRKVEQGEHDRVGAVALRKLAVALDVPVTALLSVPPEPSRAPASGEIWKPLAAALTEPGVDDEPPAARDVSSALTSATRLYHANRYAELAAVLPGIVRDSSPTLPALRSRVFQLAGSALTQARQREAARVALDRSFAYAEAAGSVLDAASAVITTGRRRDGHEVELLQVNRPVPAMRDGAGPDLLKGVRARFDDFGVVR